MKLLFFIASLRCGGAERVATILCNRWAETGWSVTLATFEDGSEPPSYPIGPRVRHVSLGLKRRSTGVVHSVANNLRRIPVLRRFVADEKPDRIVSFIDATNVLALIAAAGRGIPVVVSERIDPEHNRIPLAWRVLRRLTYPRASAVVVQTERAKAFFPASVRSLVAVIPNPVPAPAPGVPAPRAERRTIVAMGRLERQKGFDLLVRAFAGIAGRLSEWDVVIAGDGPERQALEAQIAGAGLGGRVRLAGRVEASTDLLRASEIFVLSSRFEGFPNALCEAMACGLPVVAFDCPSGPAEIVRHEIDGVLVPAGDPGALAEAIASLASDPARRATLGRRATEVTERFSLDRVASQWDRVLRSGPSRES